jgi:glutamyl-tRNA reductase
MAAALHISKDIRGQLPLLLGRHDVEDVCVDYLAFIVPQPEARIVVVGSGMVGRGLVQRLAETGRGCDWMFHRHQPDAASVPAGVRLRPWSELAASLRTADAVVCATSSREAVLGPALAGEFPAKSRVLLVDLAVPRNIDPALVAALPDARFADMDMLKEWSRRTTGSMEPLMDLSRATIHEHKALYERIIESFQSRDEGEQAGPSADAGSVAADKPAPAGYAS